MNITISIKFSDDTTHDKIWACLLKYFTILFVFLRIFQHLK